LIKILPIHTGGTIASTSQKNGAKPTLSFHSLLKKVDKDVLKDIKISKELTPFGKYGIDSSNLNLKHIKKLYKTILKNYEKYDAFLITHGTDTLSYTSSFLFYMLKNIKKPVILTASQKTIDDKNSDVISNLTTALLACKTKNHGVWVAFDKKVFYGNSITKIDSSNLSAFTSPNRNEFTIREFLKTKIKNNKKEKFKGNLSKKVAIYYLSPSTTTNEIQNYLKNDFDTIIVLVYGLGGHKKEIFKELSKSNKKIIAKSNCIYGETDLNFYEVGKNAKKVGIKSAKNLSLEAVFAKESF